MQTLYHKLRGALKQAGVEIPDLEARLILKHALAVSDADLIGGQERAVAAAEAARIDAIAARRIAGEPLSRIFGEREFWGLPFRVTPDVLDPRADSETVIETALKSFAGRTAPRTILDLGTGSGCLLIALLHEFRDAQGMGIDLSPTALEIAGENARRNSVAERAAFIEGDFTVLSFPRKRESPGHEAWNSRFRGNDSEGKFDLIVSNPPYIPSADIPNLAANVRNHDPILALDGGADGLDAYKIIVQESKKLLSPGGVLLLEIGAGQERDVARLAADAGFEWIESARDLGGHIRVLKFVPGDSGEN